MRICFHEHTAHPQTVSYWVSRCKPTVGAVSYSIYFQRANGDEPEMLLDKIEFGENESYHKPRTVYMDTGDKLIAEIDDSYLTFSVSGTEG